MIERVVVKELTIICRERVYLKSFRQVLELITVHLCACPAINLGAAFSTVDHNNLLQRVEHAVGVNGPSVVLIISM